MTGRELDGDVRAELRTLAPDNAETVARRLVTAGRLLQEDPEAAYRHAIEARRTASRVASVREAVGLAAYASGRYAEALAELRAARRMSGSLAHLPLLADCERGLGRPERALAAAAAPEVSQLDAAGRIEMRIVAAGARLDLGQPDAAVLTLQVPELKAAGKDWSARLRYAYADALLAAGRRDEGDEWLRRAAEVDPEGETDAAERLAELDGVRFTDAYSDDVETATPDAGPPRPVAGEEPGEAHLSSAPEPQALFVEPVDEGAGGADEDPDDDVR